MRLDDLEQIINYLQSGEFLFVVFLIVGAWVVRGWLKWRSR